ncbi:MAG: GNAT family N-acetyltransferase [Paludibacteraceae bacterium]|nr:GNAT family N-acetyltransferase [Paludibacteraceae bacterium]
MEEIISPIAIELLESELTSDKFLRKTNKGGNDIYLVTAHNSPNIMKEIARLREISFRSSGGGSGLSLDIDEYDTCQNPYQQLIVWNPEAREIIGGYRFIHGKDVDFDENGAPKLTSSHLFAYSEKFIKEYLPYTLELGRSFVRPEYQSSKMGAKSLFALDNLWDGIGALIIKLPDVKFFFGKATIYPSFDEDARNMIFTFMQKYFPDNEHLIYPHILLDTRKKWDEMNQILCGTNYKEDYCILKSYIRNRGLNIPPLINAYMALSPTMRTFGSCINDEFGDVIETGLMITIKDIFEEKQQRHIQTYVEQLQLQKEDILNDAKSILNIS